MANFSFSLRLALGLLPKTEKIEGERNQLIAEFKRLNEYKDSEELKLYNELDSYVNSNEFKTRKAQITSLNYSASEYCEKEKKYLKLSKDKRIKNYFSVPQSADYKRFTTIDASDMPKRYQELAGIANLAKLAKQKAKTDEEMAELQKNKALFEEFKSLKNSADLKFWTKYKNSKPYKMYVETEGSFLVSDYNELDAFVKSDEFKQQKEYLLDKNRFSKTEDAQKESKYNELKNSENIKWYQANANTNKFDSLKAWNLTFEENFDDAKIDDAKWMNSFFWGKMVLNDRYVLAGDKQYYTDNKNIDIKQSVLRILTKKEKATGKVWDAKHGFFTQDFDYTSGMLSTANSFRQQYGKFEAKIKIDAQNPVYQAFWLKGEKIEPQIDIFKYNVGKSGSLQVSTYDNGKSAGNKFGGSGLAKDFFIYSVEWEQNKITWKINGVEFASTSNAVPQEPLFIMLSAGLNKNANDANLPSAFEIDWVRCYEKA